ncbi:MAG TPA: type 4a pilus biogenesis protein PilO [Rhodocyclaceae bacterium]|nr:type 4a pilus biogenesis protein PilO [Rhodocyclaceae bacterium]
MKLKTASGPAMPKLNIQQLADDFRTLDPSDPGSWPLAPKVVILLVVFLVLTAAIGWFGWKPQLDELEVAREQENTLRQEWLSKKQQAVNLDAHRKQLEEINRTFGALLKQLPNASEVEKLLVDINQAGVGQGLQFELFQPMAEARKDFYAELPIKIKLVGTYHELGAFAGDIAKLSRIVTLNDLNIEVGKDSTLTLNTVAKTFRYLDDEEIAKQKKGAKK